MLTDRLRYSDTKRGSADAVVRRWVACTPEQMTALEDDMPCTTTSDPGGSDDEVIDALLHHSDRTDWAHDILATTADQADERKSDAS